MHLIESSSESERKACACHDTHGVYIVPAFTGLGTPYWDDDARGAVFGLTRNTTDNHFVRASLEAIAYQCKDVFEVMKQESHYELSSLKVDGGATANNYLMQFQSDILNVKIELPKCLQTTAMGASYLAGLESGFFTDRKHIESIHGCQKTFDPKMDEKEVNERYAGWKKAVEVTRQFK